MFYLRINFRRLLCGGFANKSHCGKMPVCPEGVAGLWENSRAGKIIVSDKNNKKRLGMLHSHRLPPFRAVGRQLAVWRVCGLMCHYGVWETVSFTLAVGRTTHSMIYDENPGGHSTHRYGRTKGFGISGKRQQARRQNGALCTEGDSWGYKQGINILT
jgi:hypothetical protein